MTGASQRLLTALGILVDSLTYADPVTCQLRYMCGWQQSFMGCLVDDHHGAPGIVQYCKPCPWHLLSFAQGNEVMVCNFSVVSYLPILQAAEEEEERRNNRPNYALSEDLTAPHGTPAAVPGGARRLPLKEPSHAESILSTQSTRRNYAYSLEAAPDAHPTRKHLNTFSVSKRACCESMQEQVYSTLHSICKVHHQHMG